jgi:hypothetical protein
MCGEAGTGPPEIVAPDLRVGPMTWSDLLMICVSAYCLGRMGWLGVVIGGAAVLVITIMEVLRYFGFSVSGGSMTWYLISAGLGLGPYLLGLRGEAKGLL